MSNDIKVTENSPGHISITCERSGRPINQTTHLGMFCDADECVCEQESRQIASSPEFAQIKNLVDLFSQ